MDAEAREFLNAVEVDAWEAITEPLPDGLDDLAALNRTMYNTMGWHEPLRR